MSGPGLESETPGYTRQKQRRTEEKSYMYYISGFEQTLLSRATYIHTTEG